MRSLDQARLLSLVVPFHNEERHLPKLIESLRSQSADDVPVVFVDNGSTDRSAALVRACEEVAAGKWTCIEEKRIGKFFALKTGTAFCVERLGTRCIGFLDADTYCADNHWIRHGLTIADAGQREFGYAYSHLLYVGFEHLPVFTMAYRAYEVALRLLVERVGWFANGNGFLASPAISAQYFERAEVTTEFDLRLSLFALAEARRAYLNPTPIVASARRIVVNARNFHAWCFYDREFYSKKDINDRKKLNLNAPSEADDLHPDTVDYFFERRAIKLACRHVIPLAIFDRSSETIERAGNFLGTDGLRDVAAPFRRFAWTTDVVLTDRFEAMIEAIERHPASAAVAGPIEGLMRDEYARTAAAALGAASR